jgi:hypothetical protein
MQIPRWVSLKTSPGEATLSSRRLAQGEKMDAVCRSCHTELVPGDAFCAQCGSAVEPAMTAQDGGSADGTAEQTAMLTPLPEMAQTTAPQRPRRKAVPTGAVVIGGLVVAFAVVSGVALAMRGSSSPVRQTAATGIASGTSTATATATPSPSGTPAPAASARAVATQVDTLIQDSGAARKLLAKGVSDAVGCRTSGAAEISDAMQQRQSLLNQLQALDVTVLPQGAQVKAALAQSMQFSIVADQFFLSWAQEPAVAGCTGTAVRDSVFLKADAASAQTTAVKQQFLALWNPVARQFGLPARAEPDL